MYVTRTECVHTNYTHFAFKYKSVTFLRNYSSARGGLVLWLTNYSHSILQNSNQNVRIETFESDRKWAERVTNLGEIVEEFSELRLLLGILLLRTVEWRHRSGSDVRTETSVIRSLRALLTLQKKYTKDIIELHVTAHRHVIKIGEATGWKDESMMNKKQ